MYYFLPTEKNQINHKAIKHSRGEYVRGDVHTNSVESFWAVLKRSINGTWHHVSPKHLRRYVDEASFRLNDGNCEVDTLDRMAALVRRLTDSRIPYEGIVKLTLSERTYRVELTSFALIGRHRLPPARR